MSKIIINIILVLSFIGIFAWFILYLFFSGNEKSLDRPLNYSHLIGKVIYQKDDKGIFIAKKINNNNIDLKNKNSVLNTGKNNNLIYRDGIDMFSEIYSQKIDYSFTDKKNIIDLKLGNGKYFIDFRNPLKKVIIHGNIYDIILNKGGTIYIDNSDKYVKIISFNNKSKINFINRKTKKINFVSYLYPHKFLAFSVKRLSSKVNIDSLRLSQLTSKKFGYFKNSYTDILKNKNFIFIDTIGKKIELLKKSEKENLINIINIYFNKYKKYNVELEKIKEINVGSIFGIGYIKDYFNLFFNKNKKIRYYKTFILDDLIRLFNSKNIDSKIQLRIVDNLEKLKILDNSEYKDILNILNTYYLIALNDNLTITNSSKKLYINLYSKILKNNIVDLYLIKIYDKLNFGKLNIYLELDRYFGKNKKHNLIEEEYYLGFIRENISYGFDHLSLNNKSFYKLLSLFVKYSKINEKGIIIELSDNVKEELTKKYKEELYKKFGNTLANEEIYDLINKKIDEYKNDIKKTKIITKILDNEILLEKFTKEIRNRYFKKELDGDILIRNENKIKNLGYLKKGFDSYILFFENKKNYLNEDKTKYENTIRNYEKIKEKFTEYFSALEDYISYHSRKKYGGGPSVIKGPDKNKLSIIKFKKFIYRFKGIDFNSINVKIDEKDYYNVENININGIWFSFKLYPFLGNRIDSIKIHKNENGEMNDNEIFYKQLAVKRYSINNLKKDYEHKRKKIKKDKKLKDKYKYENIFLNLFFPDVKKSNLCKGEKPYSRGMIFGSKYISKNLNITEWTYMNFNSSDMENGCLWKCADGYFKKGDKCEKNNESRFIRYIKSVKLLGDNGEFSKLKPNLIIGYKNLFVSQKDSIKKELLINFKNSKLQVRVKKGKEMIKSYAYLDGEYKLNENDHYFYNMKLRPYLIDKKGKETLLFGNNIYITLVGKKDLLNFKYDIKKVMGNLDYIISEYNKYLNYKNINSIMYDLKTNKVSFK